MEDCLADLVAAIDRGLPVPAPVRENEVLDAAQLRALYVTLHDLLRASNAQAHSHIQLHGAALRAALGPGFDPVQQAIDNFEFDDALLALSRLVPAALTVPE
jgi:hypothetical protein